jgi:hypothetical protein
MPSQRKWMLIAVAALAFSLGLATAVIAGHRFGPTCPTPTSSTVTSPGSPTTRSPEDATHPPTPCSAPKTTSPENKWPRSCGGSPARLGLSRTPRPTPSPSPKGTPVSFSRSTSRQESEAQVVLNTHVVFSNSGSTTERVSDHDPARVLLWLGGDKDGLEPWAVSGQPRDDLAHGSGFGGSSNDLQGLRPLVPIQRHRDGLPADCDRVLGPGRVT